MEQTKQYAGAHSLGKAAEHVKSTGLPWSQAMEKEVCSPPLSLEIPWQVTDWRTARRNPPCSPLQLSALALSSHNSQAKGWTPIPLPLLIYFSILLHCLVNPLQHMPCLSQWLQGPGVASPPQMHMQGGVCGYHNHQQASKNSLLAAQGTATKCELICPRLSHPFSKRG